MAQEHEITAKRAELPMRLTRLRVKNFRSIADIDIPLSPLTVLVGPNGSGKSNVVDALRFVRDVFARGLDQAVMDREGMGVIQRWGTEGITIGMTIGLPESLEQLPAYTEEAGDLEIIENIIPSAELDYEFSINLSEDNTVEIKSEKLIVAIEHNSFPVIRVNRDKDVISGEIGEFYQKKLGKRARSTEGLGLLLINELFNSISIPSFTDYDDDRETNLDYGRWYEYGRVVEGVEGRIVELLFYTLNPADLKQPQHMLKESPFDERGRNLAAVLRRISRTNKDDWGNLSFALASAVSGFRNIVIEPVGGYLATKLIYQNDNSNSRTSYIGQESDGTIRMLGLLVALHQEPSPPFISIEEPEANIHPGALAVLAGVIEEASLRSQILVTTHSPDMLDHLPVESFLVVEKVGDTTHVGPLDASQIASVRKRLFTPGELFRMEGLQRQTEQAS